MFFQPNLAAEWASINPAYKFGNLHYKIVLVLLQMSNEIFSLFGLAVSRTCSPLSSLSHRLLVYQPNTLLATMRPPIMTTPFARHLLGYARKVITHYTENPPAVDSNRALWLRPQTQC